MLLRLFVILTTLFSLSLKSQNLVPNPGFEDTTGCPGADVFLNHTPNWEQIDDHYGTPDLFYGDCAYNGIGGTNSMATNQLPYDGIGCIGLFAHGDNLREYCSVQLIEPLQKGKSYHVEFWVRPANGYGTAINSFGLHFSNSKISGESDQSLAYIPLTEHIGNPSTRLLNDTENWTKIEGDYIAKGGEEYITIGNFSSDIETESKVMIEVCIRPDRSYILLDGVSILQIDSVLQDENILVENTVRPEALVMDAFFARGNKITIEIWDRYTEDGDTINVWMNGEKILSEFRITKKHHFINVEIQDGDNILEIQALNLGTLSPNTVSVKVSDGYNTKEIILNSNMEISEALKIILPK